ncbi:uncharacterized protein LOC110453232 [Mizuhopecten yessoensis]|uniref:Uncharacterized protein n=1 Tax=Mizuhopecten yessoensis TaxID=6573 RepID=A0A210QHS3_MIZYE|nr:uncharacterized protein LOC110453232 [Mizuhopecten yessoensis]XP_021357772.1 uncharacterized protein LOC110453232 [Mizuhopecten yessoensis]OWF48304.1 hypothetical protein KP79_PYT11843 [Mizuhopecten yessoensis]
MFPKAANYYEVLEILKTEFGCDDDACENVLLDMNNREIESPDDFTILEYIKSHKKYAGTTRIYLGVRESVANDEIKDAETPSSETDPSTERDDHTSESTESKSERDDQTSKSTDPKSERDDQTSESTEDGHLLASSSEETRDDYFKDVLDFVREEQQEERKRGIMDLDGGERFDIDTRIFCPVHAVNPKVILFQEKNGNKYKKITNAYGDFFCIPQDDMEEFDRFCKTLNVNQLFIVNPPLLYYLHYVHKSENPNVQVAETASKEVWKISEDIAQSFIEWKASIASIC